MAERGDTIADELDALSLEQALRDFDVANARTVDLSQRVIKLSAELAQRDAEILRLRADAGRARAELDRVVGTRAYRLAQRYWAAKGAFGR